MLVKSIDLLFLSSNAEANATMEHPIWLADIVELQCRHCRRPELLTQ